MRSAEGSRRHVALLLAAGTTLAGCASLPEPVKNLQAMVAPSTATTPAASPVAPPATAAVTPQAVPAATSAKPEPETPVPPAAQRAFDDARRAMAAGRAQDAERGLRALTQSHPDLGGPHANLGLLHRQAGRLPEAAAALEQAVKLGPKQAVYHNQLGITYRQMGQFSKARAAYERAIELEPEYAAPHLNLGILHDLYLREPARALELYDRYAALTAGKDAVVAKWIADLRNRKPDKQLVSKKEQP